MIFCRNLPPQTLESQASAQKMRISAGYHQKTKKELPLCGGSPGSGSLGQTSI